MQRDVSQILSKNKFDPLVFDGEVADIPPIPVHIFKAIGHKLSSVSDDTIKAKLQSSATSGVPSTILLDKVTARRQTRAMARVMQEVLGLNVARFALWILIRQAQMPLTLGLVLRR